MKKYLMAGAALLVLSACATQPEPELMPEPEPVVEVQPQIIEPEPIPEAQPLPPVVEPFVDPNLPIPGSEDDFAFQSGGEPRVFFGYDQFNLSPEAQDVLRRQANWLNIYQDAIATIEGHADERGTREYNLALGARRADSVKAFLVSQGVAPNRLRTISYGKERPIDPRANEAGWSRNRNGHTNLRLGGIG
ncbi:peptidoglycan-associated lipoprotein Pal [Litorimonas sp. WD9-15]|uniref:peptidoglycan-associated lipoprotein Pal n=1 Tax=Litorimonas sp. WD9-15 TaxID=3418716 RepID=UPI003D0230CE